jgi:hypothetical protein
MNVKVKLVSVDRLKQFIKTVPRGMKKVGMEAVADWMIGDKSRGLRHNPAYKYVTRKSAYGVTFFTEKQRRWFWANGGPDMIGNNRTGQTAESWEANIGAPYDRLTIRNTAPGAVWTMGDKTQARQPAKVGWRKTMEVVQKNMAGAIRHAQAAVNKMIKSKA